MKKTLILTAMLVAPLALASPNGKPFVELQGEIVEVQGEISTLQDQIDAIVGQVNSVEERLVVSENAITSLQSQVTFLQNQIDTYGNDISAIQDSIINLEQENIIIQTQIAANGSDIVTLQGQIDANISLISQLRVVLSGLATLEDQVINNTTLIAYLQNEVTEITEEIATKQAIISESCPDGSAIQAIQADGSIVCNYTMPGSTLEWAKVWLRFSADSAGYVYGKVYCPNGYILTSGGFQRIYPGTLNKSLIRIANSGTAYYWNFQFYTTPYKQVVMAAHCIR